MDNDGGSRGDCTEGDIEGSGVRGDGKEGDDGSEGDGKGGHSATKGDGDDDNCHDGDSGSGSDGSDGDGRVDIVDSGVVDMDEADMWGEVNIMREKSMPLTEGNVGGQKRLCESSFSHCQAVVMQSRQQCMVQIIQCRL